VLVFLGAVLVTMLGTLTLRWIGHAAIAGSLRRAAAARGLSASWRSFDLQGVLTVRVHDLALTRPAGGDTLFRAELLSVSLDPWSLLVLSVHPTRVALAHARLAAPGGAGVEADSLAAEVEAVASRAAAAQVRRAAQTLARLVLAPTRGLPELLLQDVALETGRSEESALAGGWIAHLELTHRAGAVRIAGQGRLALEPPVPFDLALDYARDDRLAGRLWFGVEDPARHRLDSLVVRVDGAVTQDRRHGEARLADDTRLWIGSLPLTIGGRIARRGPAASLRLAATGLTQSLIEQSIPAPLLGPLADLAVRGSFDYRLRLDLDVAQPDSVDFAAAVIPHGLQLDPDATRLPILSLDQPFTAVIHLPHDRTATRELSSAKLFYRPLDRIDSILVHAVVTNEDGGFFRHHGFNLEAMKGAISENLRAGAYRRGAGTITMQLARNLYLGHQRTLSRKAQEVVLAWTLEHLTGVSKRRLLEIYLNIVEWGPGVHGAAEAALYYFGADPAQLTPAQALFLSTLLPSPTRWRGRVDKDGEVRPWTRAQMHFIGRAMIAKGWLDPADLPPADSLEVRVNGPARRMLSPESPPLAVPADSARAEGRSSS